MLCICADYFDVSLDYIFVRTDSSEGELYEAHPKTAEDNEEIRQFMEMCFDAKSKISIKLKGTIYRMMIGEKASEIIITVLLLECDGMWSQLEGQYCGQNTIR